MQHLSVLYEEALQALDIKVNGIYLDCTFGRGGHSKGILERLGNDGHLLAFDRDLAAVNSDTAKRLKKDDRFELHHDCFTEIGQVIDQHGWSGEVNGILMDLGVSSPQLDDASRGFSFLREGPLDMRMDKTKGISAAEWLRKVEEQDLVKVLFEYGEERFARRIASAIVQRQKQQPMQTTLELAQLIEQVVPKREKNKHSATRSFQAIRIEINNELEQLKTGLQQTLDLLAPGGRLVIISFHSLEDRIVKRFIRNESGRKFNPGKLPVRETEIEQGVLKKLGKTVKADSREIEKNPRARSAVMRVAEKV